MGLDTFFYAQHKTEIGYFRKHNFLLHYFEVKDDDNCVDIHISKEKLTEFVNDLKVELNTHKTDNTNVPVNNKLQTKSVCFGGSTEYDEYYWEDLNHVYQWANGVLNSFDWDNCSLIMNNWW